MILRWSCMFHAKFCTDFEKFLLCLTYTFPPCIMCVQYIGGCSVHRGVFSTSGGYHEYIGGIS